MDSNGYRNEPEWREVPGFDPDYLVEASSDGQVRVSFRYFTRADGRVYLAMRGKRREPVDRLVANAFVDNPGKYRKVVHLNGDVTDCRACNLKFLAPGEEFTPLPESKKANGGALAVAQVFSPSEYLGRRQSEPEPRTAPVGSQEDAKLNSVTEFISSEETPSIPKNSKQDEPMVSSAASSAPVPSYDPWAGYASAEVYRPVRRQHVTPAERSPEDFSAASSAQSSNSPSAPDFSSASSAASARSLYSSARLPDSPSRNDSAPSQPNRRSDFSAAVSSAASRDASVLSGTGISRPLFAPTASEFPESMRSAGRDVTRSRSNGRSAVLSKPDLSSASPDDVASLQLKAKVLSEYSPEQLKSRGLKGHAFNAKKVCCTLRNGEEKVFDTVSEAARFAGVSHAAISMSCRGRMGLVKGMRFRYVDLRDVKSVLDLYASDLDELALEKVAKGESGPPRKKHAGGRPKGSKNKKKKAEMAADSSAGPSGGR